MFKGLYLIGDVACALRGAYHDLPDQAQSCKLISEKLRSSWRVRGPVPRAATCSSGGRGDCGRNICTRRQRRPDLFGRVPNRAIIYCKLRRAARPAARANSAAARRRGGNTRQPSWAMPTLPEYPHEEELPVSSSAAALSRRLSGGRRRRRARHRRPVGSAAGMHGGRTSAA